MLTPSTAQPASAEHPASSEQQQAPSAFAPFFTAAAGAAVTEEARRMAASARAVLHGDDADTAVEHAWYVVDNAVRTAFELFEAGRLPLAAVEVAAGLTGVARPKDYGVRPIWSLAWELAGQVQSREDEGLLDEDALEIVASMEAACGPEAARELRDRFEEAEREAGSGGGTTRGNQ